MRHSLSLNLCEGQDTARAPLSNFSIFQVKFEFRYEYQQWNIGISSLRVLDRKKCMGP